MALIEITNIASPAATVNIADLGDLDLTQSAATDVSTIFSLEEIANSTDLQAAITASDVELRVDGVLITDVTKAPFQPALKKTYTWGASRRGEVAALAIDLRREGRTETNRAPFYAPIALTLETLEATSTSTNAWDVRILTSTSFPPGSWSTAYTGSVTGGSTTLSPALNIAAGTYVRVRYIDVTTETDDPSANLFLVEQ